MIKQILTLIFIAISTLLVAQKTDYNTKDGYISEGYDVVSYFLNEKPLIGKNKFQVIHDGIKFRFSSEKNLNIFKSNPIKYIPQYGGYCAYAVAAKNIKMSIDAESYEIRDGKLYLFYNSWWSNKLDTWVEGNTEKLQEDGDANWIELKHKKS